MFTLVAVTVALTATATAQGVIGGNLDAGKHPAQAPCSSLARMASFRSAPACSSRRACS